MKRRSFLAAGAAALVTPAIGRGAFAAEAGAPLPIPEIWDLSDGASTDLVARTGRASFLSGRDTSTIGYSQNFLGPVLRVRRGSIARPRVINELNRLVTAHWHGLHVPGEADGGPQLAIAPGRDWAPELEIDQPETTLWYHSHIHGETGPQVYQGLAGMMLLTDPDAGGDALPSEWGVDDIPLIIQDRTFDGSGQFAYSSAGPNRMMGFRGDRILVNGAIQPVASVAQGVVRLRILNGSNARIYRLSFDDGRDFRQIASDAGYLSRPSNISQLTLAPAERVELLVDLSDGAPVKLLSEADDNSPMAGMMGDTMGGMMGDMMGGGSPQAVDGSGRFEVMSLSPDRPTNDLSMPENLPLGPGAIPGEPVRRRAFDLSMSGMMGGGMGNSDGGMMGGGVMNRGGGMMGGGMMDRNNGGMMGGGMSLGINGQPYSMDRIDADVGLGDVEIWEVRADMMQHPFHVHGTSFQVLSANGRPVDFDTMGLKDVALVDQSMEIKISFDRTAPSAAPYMLHCHILEHEDAGMMAQFTVG